MAQQIIVFLIVAAAVFYIGRMLWGALSGKGGCHSCSANHTSGPKSKTKSTSLPEHLIQMQTSFNSQDKTNGTAKPH